MWRRLETSWNTQLEPLWSNPIGADLANVSAAMMWVLDEGDAEGALRMAVGLDRFWIFSVPPPAVRLAWLEAALDLPWSPSSVVGIRARAKAYHLAGLLKTRADPVAAQGLLRARTECSLKRLAMRPAWQSASGIMAQPAFSLATPRKVGAR